MLIEFHVIQDHGPSNMNRGQDGRPKTAYYAGTQRLRVSSQCCKRTLRQPRSAGSAVSEPGVFEKTVGSSHFGVRTRLLPEKVVEKWVELHGPAAPFQGGIKAAVSVVAQSGGKIERTLADGQVRTPQAIYLELDREVDRIVSVLDRLHSQEELESIADENEVFKSHLKAAVESLRWDGKPKDITKVFGWDAVSTASKWSQLAALLDEADIAVPPEGMNPELSSDKLIPSYELAHAFVRLLMNLEGEDEPASKKLRNLFKPAVSSTKKKSRQDLEQLLEVTSLQAMSAADIALFGRMTTSKAFRDVEAACQMADAISTHPADIEQDFFTAVDDLDEGTGAAFASPIPAQFSSAVFYKNLVVDYGALLRNLGADIPMGKDDDESLKALAAESPVIAAKAIEGLLRALLHNVPSGKINSHAHNQQPSLILVEVKPQNVATSYLTAFHEPAKGGEREDGFPETLLTDSVQKLLAFARYRDRKLKIEGTQRFVFANDEPTEDAIERLRDRLKEGSSGSLTDDTFFKNSSLKTCDDFESFVDAVNKAVKGDAAAEGGAA